MAGFTFGKSIEKAIRQSAGDISDRSTCAANSTATGLGIKSANLGKIAKFTITSRDSQSRQRKRGGDVYAVKLNKGECEVKVDVKDNGNGTYLAEYTVPYQDFLSDMILMSPFVVQLTRCSSQSGRKSWFSEDTHLKLQRKIQTKETVLSTYWHYFSFYIQQSKGLFTWSGGPRSSEVSFFCFHALGDIKQKKLTPLDRGPPLHVTRV